ncbi:MAG: hypothetical protein OHK0015_25080 [Chloroflexi bacterium OHK40]
MQEIILSWVDPATALPRHERHTLPVQIGREASNTIVIDDTRASRRHAELVSHGGQVVLNDLASRNGVRIAGRPVARAVIGSGSRFEIGGVRFTVELPETLPAAPDREGTVLDAGEGTVLDAGEGTVLDAGEGTVLDAGEGTVLDAGEGTVVGGSPDAPASMAPVAPALRARGPSSLPLPAWPPAIFRARQVALRDLEALGVPTIVAEYGAVGAGLGSFAWIDYLRICGVPVDQIVALGVNPKPYGHYQLLCGNSQIPDHERLRSNSESTPDNIWGWPGYALREIWWELRRGAVGRAAGVWWQIFGEPSLAQTYTPRIGNVFRALDREARRIGWEQIFRYGRVRAIRQTDDGRYVVAYSTRGTGAPAGTPAHGLLIARYLHLAIGYPAIQVLPDLQRYREATGDFTDVVNAYEAHDQIYERLRRHGGLVMVRGRGIVASRILQRIAEERAHNPQIGVIHLMRSPLAAGRRSGMAQRAVHQHFELQPFNWPRGCWTGPQRKQLERASPADRKRLLGEWGGTTTARRRDWVELIERGLREGWYQVAFGEVERVERDSAGRLSTTVRARGQVRGELSYATDFIIDATGLDATIEANPLLQDLVRHYNLALNPLERLHVENDFEVPGLRNGDGRVYAAGAMTLGGPVAAVDSFLGLQLAAFRSVESLWAQRALGVRRLSSAQSIVQWLKWVRGVKP